MIPMSETVESLEEQLVEKNERLENLKFQKRIMLGRNAPKIHKSCDDSIEALNSEIKDIKLKLKNIRWH